MAPRTASMLALALAVSQLAAAGPLSHDSLGLLKRDPPAALSECASAVDFMWQPVLDFDTDGCYNTPAIGPDGTLAEGLDNCYTTGESGCRDESDLEGNQVYSRARCNNGWCAIMYGYYFEKDVGLESVCGEGAGHRHDWEHIIVWVSQGKTVEEDVIRYVSVSAHGNYDTRPVEEVRMEGNRPKVVYHKDGIGTHALRFANEDDDAIENHRGVWFRGALLSWNGFPVGLRDTLVNQDWKDATIDFKDSDNQFGNILGEARGDIPEIRLDVNLDYAPPELECV